MQRPWVVDNTIQSTGHYVWQTDTMDEISDTNDNKNRKISLIQLIDGSEKTKTIDTDSPWIQFQGNNNNVIEKTSLRKMNCGGVVSGRPTENGSNELAMNVHLPQSANEKEFYESSPPVRSPVRKTMASTEAHNGIGQYNGVFATDNSGLKPSPDDTDVDDQSDNNSTDNLSFLSDDGNNGLIDDIVLLPNNLISEDELSTNSDDCVYAYRGADFDPIPVNPESDENDFLEMDFEPDPASEVEQENNTINNVQMNNVSPLFELSPSTEFAAKSTESSGDFDLGLKLPVPVHANESPSPVNVWKKATETVSNHNDSISDQQQDEHDPIKCCQGKHRQISDDDHLLKKTAGSSESKLNGGCLPTNPQTYYDNTVTLSMKKYTGTIPKTSRSLIGARTSRSKSSIIVPSLAKPPDNDGTNLKCRDCTENNQSNSSNSESWRSQNCHRCQALQPFSHSNGQLHHGFNSAVDVCLVRDQPRSVAVGAAKRSLSFPVVALSDDGYSDRQSVNGLAGTSYSTNGIYGTSDLKHYEERSLHIHEMVPVGAEGVDGVGLQGSVPIYSICFTEDIILEALVSRSF